MEDKDFLGKLVYLTVHVERWLKELNSNFNVPMANRLAKVVKVFDWETEEGKLLLKAREQTGKWNNTMYNSKEFKFVLKIYYPELIVKNRNKGFFAIEVFPLKYPGTQLNMFELVPKWMLDDMNCEEKDIFKIVEK